MYWSLFYLLLLSNCEIHILPFFMEVYSCIYLAEFMDFFFNIIMCLWSSLHSFQFWKYKAVTILLSFWILFFSGGTLICAVFSVTADKVCCKLNFFLHIYLSFSISLFIEFWRNNHLIFPIRSSVLFHHSNESEVRP